MEWSQSELTEALRQLDSILHKLRGTVQTLEGRETPERYRSQLTLARRRINVASMQVFRSAPGGEAVMVLECDSHIPEDLEPQLTAVPGIRKVTCLNVDDKT